ncbi:MAG: hypothetical protein C0619_06120 [Desulfuromonas sp.]|jgi:hypothetical protein|nr:MAG: hypothetical protein C0619_06120 [Desulfuromonas sp.]
MIVGFNHNITYQGVCFHVQTEDSGVRSPHLITLLYHGGTIICSQKTSYADILNVDDLDKVVEDLAKEQHKGMLRRLKKGEFNQRIGDLGIELKPAAQQDSPVPEEVTEIDQVSRRVNADSLDARPDADSPKQTDVENVDRPAAPETATTDLDDLIFAYLSGDDGK